ncbi:MAG: PAS domain S-box protein, partial [Desulfatitalea sp.]|nr:PAS domain S-box protein [Desulfatitalea sp.]
MADAPLIYNSRLLKMYTAYLDVYFPDIDLDLILAEVGLSKLEIEDPGHWFDQQQIDAFYAKIVQITGNAAIARDFGRYAVATDAAGAMKQHALGLLNISSIYMLIAKLYPMLSRGAIIDARKLERNKVEITVDPKVGIAEMPYQCESRIGIFESLSTLFSAKYATIYHPECVHRGDQSCRYEISWEEPHYRKWKRFFTMGLYLSPLMILLGALLLPPTLLPMAICICLLALMGLRLRADLLEKQELTQTIQNQGNAAEDHIKEVDYRYRGALLVQRIGQATSELLDLNQLAEVVVGNIENYLDFDRGIVMLADEANRRLVYAAGFGFNEDKIDILKKTRFRLDNPDAKGVFIKVFHEQRPILVEDLNTFQDAFSDRSQRFARQLGSKSLICLPIVYENRSLGILAVDNIESKRHLTQSDMNLLMGVAYQTAVSIFSIMAYKKLQESKERYRSLYDNAPTAYLTIGVKDAVICNCNVAASRLLGHTRAKLVGSRWLDHFSGDRGNRARAQWIFEILKKGQSVHSEELKLTRSDGKSVWASLSMTSHKDPKGNVIEGRCVLIDMTERKRLAEKLRRAQKMEAMGMLAGGVAHDLSNILAAIVSYPDLLLMDIEKNNQLYDPLTKIKAAGTRAAAIVQDLLILARRGVQVMEVVDLNAIAKDYLNSPEFDSLSEHHAGIKVTTRLSSQLNAIKGSAVHISKTMMNLLNNAAEAMPHGGEIQITTYMQALTATNGIKGGKKGRFVVLSVKDNGTGIAEDDLSRIFEPFFTKKVMGRSGT